MKFFMLFVWLILFTPIAFAADNNEIKSWLGGKKITVKKMSVPIPDKKESIDIGSIKDIKVMGKETSMGAVSSITTMLIKFAYKYNSTDIPCTAAITYTWATLKGPAAAKNLELVILNSDI